MKALPGVTREYIRVLVADSNQTQSQLLSGALRRQKGMKVTSCRGELSDCVQVLRSASVDVVLLGGGAPDHDQIDTLRSLQATHPHMRLILLLDSYDRNLVVNAVRAGSVDYSVVRTSRSGLCAGVFQLSTRASCGPTLSRSATWSKR